MLAVIGTNGRCPLQWVRRTAARVRADRRDHCGHRRAVPTSCTWGGNQEGEARLARRGQAAARGAAVLDANTGRTPAQVKAFDEAPRHHRPGASQDGRQCQGAWCGRRGQRRALCARRRGHRRFGRSRPAISRGAGDSLLRVSRVAGGGGVRECHSRSGASSPCHAHSAPKSTAKMIPDRRDRQRDAGQPSAA